VSHLENSEKFLEKVIRRWVDLEGHRGVQRYSVWYISGIGQVQKWGQDNRKTAGQALCCCGDCTALIITDIPPLSTVTQYLSAAAQNLLTVIQHLLTAPQKLGVLLYYHAVIGSGLTEK